MSIKDTRLEGMLVFITGSCGLLGNEHAIAVLESSGLPVLIDIDETKLRRQSENLSGVFRKEIPFFCCDIAKEDDVKEAFDSVIEKYKNKIMSLGLINNAAINPKIESGKSLYQRPENIKKEDWNRAFDVGLFGALVCANLFHHHFKSLSLKNGAIINISSDHGLISPKQSLYYLAESANFEQPIKPITYTLVKHAIIGMTRYLSTYWATEGIRVNTLCPGGVYANQNAEFLDRFSREVPMGRMANSSEYKGSVVFLLSKDSSYMTGATLVVDGGRTVW
jgi:NAD(P)-dependent dehydrogenase (short-subunit alcohol dehydrogenase family)